MDITEFLFGKLSKIIRIMLKRRKSLSNQEFYA